MRTKELIQKLGEFYYLNYKDSYEEKIAKIGFTKVLALNKQVILIVRRPGILIGKRGQDIEKLKNHLGCDMMIIEDEESYVEDQIIIQADNSNPELCGYSKEEELAAYEALSESLMDDVNSGRYSFKASP